MCKKIKIAFIGCVESSYTALSTLLSMECVEVVAVVTRDLSKVNSDFVDLSELCTDNCVPFYYEDPSNKKNTVEFLKKIELDVIYCIGWSYLLSDELLAMPKNGVIGFHPAKLPENRGRHPIIWALALGLPETASTFFKMDSGADSGPIVSQETINIDSNDNAGSLYKKILNVSQSQLVSLTEKMFAGSLQFTEQDDSTATYWRKRCRSDGLIDWRMGADSIHNLIRALSRPYPGAEFNYKGKYIQVFTSSLELESKPENCEPGKVLARIDSDILVKCAGRYAIWLHDLEFSDIPYVGEYL
jgi:methionyl-tRNA formyltransferase